MPENLGRIPDGKLKDSLRVFLTTANQDLEKWRADLERWFDDKMDRVSGWYKRRTRWWSLLWGLLVVVAFNADTVVLARAPYSDSSLRASVVAAADNIVQAVPSPTPGVPSPSRPPCPITTEGQTSPPPSGTLPCVAEQVRSIQNLGLPIGWSSGGPGWPRAGIVGIGLKIIGLVITATALTLGAPFWFDLLNKFINFRASGRLPPKREEGEG